MIFSLSTTPGTDKGNGCCTWLGDKRLILPGGGRAEPGWPTPDRCEGTCRCGALSCGTAEEAPGEGKGEGGRD